MIKTLSEPLNPLSFRTQEFLSFRSAQRRGTCCRVQHHWPRPRSPRPTSSLLPHPPERTHPKPRKRQCETNCNHHPPHPYPPGLVSRVLVSRGNPTTARHHYENKPRNLQPQLRSEEH